jgi:putative spermidine/putrescine transport system permease protein
MSSRRFERALNWVILGLLVFIILFPVFVVFQYAFATRWFATDWFPQEFGLRWFRQILGVGNIVNALVNSYVIATLVTVCTLIITIPAGYVFGTRAHQDSFRGRRLVENFSNMPLAFPTITVGIGLLPMYSKLGLLSSVGGIVLAHMIMAVPYALRAIVSSFLLIPPHYEEAARNLGAGRVYIIRRIYLPLIWPGIVAAAIFAFSWSLNEFVLVLLLGYPDVETIPIQIYQYVGGYYLHPQQAAALGLFLLVPTLLLMFVVERTLKTSTVVPAGA